MFNGHIHQQRRLEYNRDFSSVFKLIPLLLVSLIRIDFIFLEVLFGEEFGISAEKNIGAAAGHVGGNCDLPLASRLGDDISFASGVFRLRIEHIVRHVSLFQTSRKHLRVFH